MNRSTLVFEPLELAIGAFPEAELDDLVSVLLKCDSLAIDTDREQVIARLRRIDPSLDVRSSGSPRSHVYHLAQACARRPERFLHLLRVLQSLEGEITPVREAAQLVEEITGERPLLRRHFRQLLVRVAPHTHVPSNQLSRIARYAAPPRFPLDLPTNAGLVEIAQRLAECVDGRPLLIFLELVSRVSGGVAPGLRQVAAAIGADLDTETLTLESEVEFSADLLDEQLAVLVDVEPDLFDPAVFMIRSWLWDGEPVANSAAVAVAVHASADLARDAGLRRAVAQAVDPGVRAAVARGHNAAHQMLVELLLPREGLTWDVDAWPVGGRSAEPLGQRFRTVVRWRDRSVHAHDRLDLESAGYTPMIWAERWKWLTEAAPTTPIYCFLDEVQAEQQPSHCHALQLGSTSDYTRQEQQRLIAFLKTHRGVTCVVTPLLPPTMPTEPDMLYTLLDHGVPVIVWPRSADLAQRREVARLLLRHTKPADLRAAVWQMRQPNLNTEVTSEVPEVTLLWDDPRRQPPMPGGFISVS